MTALIANTRLFATEELTLGIIAFQRTNSMPAAAMAMSANLVLRAARRIFKNRA